MASFFFFFVLCSIDLLLLMLILLILPQLDMSSVCGGLDYKDAESHLTSSSASSPCSNNGSNHVSVSGSEDAQESDGDDSGNIHQYLNDVSKDITEPVIPEPLLPLKSSDDEGEDKNLAEDMLSESVSCHQTLLFFSSRCTRTRRC